MDFVQTWEGGRYPTSKETTHEAAVKQQQTLVAKLKELRPRLQAAGAEALKTSTVIWDPRDGDFRKQFLDQVLRNIDAKEKQLQVADRMWRDAVT